MTITPNDVLLLRSLAHYYVLTREQIQQICFPSHQSGRSTRRHLLKLRNSGLIERHSVVALLPNNAGAAPVYYPTKKGAEFLASQLNDEKFLTTNTNCPRADRLSHWISLNATRIIVEAAIAKQTEVRLDGWISEWQTVNPDARASDRFVLHTQLNQNPPLSCSPDAAFQLESRGHRKVYYVEQDRATSSPQQIAARKTKGYAELATRQGHRRHFPNTTIDQFGVLFITTNAYRCRATAKELEGKPRPDLWLFIDQSVLKPESFLFEPIAQNYRGEMGPLITKSAAEVIPPDSSGVKEVSTTLDDTLPVIS